MTSESHASHEAARGVDGEEQNRERHGEAPRRATERELQHRRPALARPFFLVPEPRVHGLAELRRHVEVLAERAHVLERDA